MITLRLLGHRSSMIRSIQMFAVYEITRFWNLVSLAFQFDEKIFLFMLLIYRLCQNISVLITSLLILKEKR